MKSKCLYMSDAPFLKWHDWDDLESLSGDMVSHTCLVFHPGDLQIYFMALNFKKMVWNNYSCFGSHGGRSFEIDEISHWTHIPEVPQMFNSGDAMIRRDDWLVGKRSREVEVIGVKERFRAHV